MSNIVASQEKNMQAVESALVLNDLSKMSTEQRLTYYKAVCESVGLNYMTQPFAYITLQGKITLYARRDAADQLRKIHGVSVQILEKKVESGLYIVTVKAKDKTGRTDEATGIIPIDGLKGAELANAMLKTETKAKRRVTLSICGLGMIDESELDTVENIGFTDNPQVQNPFRKDEPKDVTPSQDIPEVMQDEDLGETVITFGKYNGKMFKDLDIFALDGYMKWVVKSAKDQNRDVTGKALDFVQKAEAYLISRESPQEPEGA
ncbi:MAG: hypothetical protein JNL11_17410 [Bdellovibrionaceae bacterium]|nr:hypothetical protein [Pseudobdellovibrionaceae bacterium]